MKKIKGLLMILLLLAPIVSCAAAAEKIPAGSGGKSVDEIAETIFSILKYAFWLAAGVCIVLVAWGALQWATSGGDAAKAGTARLNLIYGVIGIVAILGLMTLVKFVAGLFGITVGSYLPI